MSTVLIKNHNVVKKDTYNHRITSQKESNINKIDIRLVLSEISSNMYDIFEITNQILQKQLEMSKIDWDNFISMLQNCIEQIKFAIDKECDGLKQEATGQLVSAIFSTVANAAGAGVLVKFQPGQLGQSIVGMATHTLEGAGQIVNSSMSLSAATTKTDGEKAKRDLDLIKEQFDKLFHTSSDQLSQNRSSADDVLKSINESLRNLWSLLSDLNKRVN